MNHGYDFTELNPTKQQKSFSVPRELVITHDMYETPYPSANTVWKINQVLPNIDEALNSDPGNNNIYYNKLLYLRNTFRRL